MQHGIDFETFQHPHGRPRELHVAVRIADDAESHIAVPNLDSSAEAQIDAESD